MLIYVKLFINFLRLIYVASVYKGTIRSTPCNFAASTGKEETASMYPAERKEGIPLEHLVTKAQQGDGRAFVRLIEMNKQSMYKVARSYFTNDEDIADAIQDTIETCYRSISHLAEAQYFRTWLTRILINKCIDILRKNKREHPVSEFPEYGESSMELNNYEFNELMNSLDEKYRTILLLYYGEGFKISEIAQLLDMEENTVKTRLSRGRSKFRELWTVQETVHQN